MTKAWAGPKPRRAGPGSADGHAFAITALDPSPAAAGQRSRRPFGRFGPGRDVDEVYPPSPGRLPPFPTDLGAVPVRLLFSVYNPWDERRPSLPWLRVVGFSRRTRPRAFPRARQGSRASGGVAARGRAGDRTPGFGGGIAARRPRAVDRGAGVASRSGEPASGARREIRASPPDVGCNALSPHGRPRSVTAQLAATCRRDQRSSPRKAPREPHGGGRATRDQEATLSVEAPAASATLTLRR